MKNPIFLTAVFILSLASVGVVAQTKLEETKPAVSGPNIDGLYETVKKFQDAWYKEKNEEKFWSFVTAVSILRDFVQDFGRTGNPFLVPFETEPEKAKPETLKVDGINREHLERVKKENLKPLPLNLDTASDVVIFEGTDEFLKKSFNLTDENLAEAKKDKDFPKGEFFLVLYGVSGEGYSKYGFVTFWVKERKDWKLFNIVLVDRW